VYEHFCKVWLNFAILFEKKKNAIFRKGTSTHFDTKLWQMTPMFSSYFWIKHILMHILWKNENFLNTMKLTRLHPFKGHKKLIFRFSSWFEKKKWVGWVDFMFYFLKYIFRVLLITIVFFFCCCFFFFLHIFRLQIWLEFLNRIQWNFSKPDPGLRKKDLPEYRPSF
jgi:hypothetical protein